MSTQPISVLLVDDDEITCDLFKTIMYHHQYPLVVFHDAETAIDYIKTHQPAPEAIVIDIFLPGLDGYQMANVVRKDGLDVDSTLIATTAYYTSDTPASVRLQGFDGYLPKPFSTAEI